MVIHGISMTVMLDAFNMSSMITQKESKKYTKRKKMADDVMSIITQDESR